MPLNSLIESYSINTISQKTNISIEVIDRLLNKDWESMQRAKVNGFLSIIEREFSVDLSKLKEESNNYYATHTTTKSSRTIDLIDGQSASSGGKVISTLVTLASVTLVLYAGWFYFIKDKSSLITKDNNSSGLFDNTIDAAKKLVGIDEKNSTIVNISTTDSNISSNKELNKSSKQSTTIAVANSTEKKSNSANIDNNSSNKKFDITTTSSSVESQSTNTTEANTATETIASSEQNISLQDSNSSNTTNQTVTIIEDTNNNITKSIKDEVDALIAEGNITDSNSSENNKSIEATEENITKEENLTSSTNQTETDVVESINSITLTSKAKSIWIGLYNIDKNKRVVKTPKRGRSYTYNANGNKIAIVTGHSRFTITTDSGLTKSFIKKGVVSHKTYLLIDNGEIKELTRSEYKKVTKRKAW